MTRFMTAVLAMGFGACAFGQAGLADVEPAEAMPAEAMEDLRFARNLSRAFSFAAERVEPAVVHITTTQLVQRVGRDFFGRRRALGSPEERQAGLGSGVIVDAAGGIVVTNNHVIENGQRLLVRLSDGREFDAELIGADETTDLAVLRIDAEGLEEASFGDSDALMVGEWVLAIGSPFGYDQTVTAGIVSAKGRGLRDTADAGYEEYLQTDASINPGNSGGPLIDLEGNVIGINTAIISRVGQNSGLGFAIPSRIAESVVASILERGSVERGYLGVGMAALDPAQAREMGLPAAIGVLLDSVEAESPASEAGLRVGDIVVAVNGRDVEGVGETAVNRLRNLIAFTGPGETIDLKVIRRGQPLILQTRLGERSEYIARAISRSLIAEAERVGARAITELGVIVQELTPELNELLGFSRGQRGEVVRYVHEEAPADLAGLKAGDVILESREMDVVDGRRVYRFEVLRAGERFPLEIEVG